MGTIIPPLVKCAGSNVWGDTGERCIWAFALPYEAVQNAQALQESVSFGLRELFQTTPDTDWLTYTLLRTTLLTMGKINPPHLTMPLTSGHWLGVWKPSGLHPLLQAWLQSQCLQHKAGQEAWSTTAQAFLH